MDSVNVDLREKRQSGEQMHNRALWRYFDTYIYLTKILDHKSLVRSTFEYDYGFGSYRIMVCW